MLDGITSTLISTWDSVSSKLPLAGGTLTGFLTLHAAPTDNMHAVTKKYVDDKMAASGSGDMTKAVYDTNEDGVVDKAEAVPWSGVTGKPSTFPPSTHTHTPESIGALDKETYDADGDGVIDTAASLEGETF